jgi:Outer membrane protein beta-barrel domain
MRTTTLSLLLTCIYFLCLPLTSFGQKFTYGFKASINTSTFVSDSKTAFTFQSKAGLEAAVHFQERFGEHFTFHQELLYAQRGAKLDNNSFKIHYVALPFVLHYHFVPNFSVGLGIETAYAIHSELFLGLENKFDEAIVGEILYKFNPHLSIQTRFTRGFVPTEKIFFTDGVGNPEDATPSNFFNQTFSIGLLWTRR